MRWQPSIALSLHGNLPVLSLNPNSKKPVPLSILQFFSEARIKKKLTTLNTSKSPGPDHRHSRVLKEVAQSIAKPIQQLFSLTMNEGSLPLIWKRANVSPIFKKGKKQLASNYRPVSLTCILCKVQESIIRDDIIAHMNANGLISKRQFGFLSGRSTILQLLYVMDE